MKTAILALIACGLALAQTSNFAAAGVSYGDGPAGTAIYAKAVDQVGTYSFTVMDAVPTSTKPLTVSTQIATGLAQRLTCLTIGTTQACVYIPGAAGVSWQGDHTGWAWSAGGLVDIQPKGWKISLDPSVRVVKSSVSNGSGYQLIGGLLIGFKF